MSNPQDYTVGWICAITTESVAAQSFLDERHDPPAEVAQNDNNSYALGRIGKHNVAIAVMPDGEYGLSSATSVARDMLHTFPNIRIGLMVGVGGGAPSEHHDVRLGDVVVSSPRSGNGGVIQYDFGKAIQDCEFLETGFLNQPPTVLRTAVSGLRARYEVNGHQLEEHINKVLQEKTRLRKKYSRPHADSDRLYKSEFTHQDPEGDCRQSCGDDSSNLVVRHSRNEDEDNPMIHYGPIASANRLMKDARSRDKLAAEKGVLCFEMEAAGLMNNFPCLVIRGICDYADSHKNKEWQGFAAMAAAAYARDLLHQIPPNKIESERRIKEALTDVQRDLACMQKVTHDVKTDVHAMRTNSHAARIKRWLSPADPSTNANKARKSRHMGTGTWFLESDHFAQWKLGLRRHMWLYGMPGCGKTVLSATILDHLNGIEDFLTVYFFFDFTDTRKQKLAAVLRSLAFQLYASRPESQKYLDSLFNNGQEQPDTDKLSVCLMGMMQAPGKLVVQLDALDECSERRELLEWMESISTVAHVQLIATGRPEVEFERTLRGWVGTENCLPLNKECVNADINSYVAARLDQSPEFKRWAASPDLLGEIRDTISNKADGMFRWAVCQLDHLRECLDRESLEEALQSLPEDLNTKYARIIQNIPRERKNKTIRLLQFLVYSERPLSLAEAVDVIAVRLNKGGFDTRDRIPIDEEITGYCSSLISLVQAPGRVAELELQLSHFSVKEYLMSCDVTDFIHPTPLVAITETCLAYLGSIRNEGDIYGICEYFPLARYAAETWVSYAKQAEVSEELVDSVVRFLQDRPKFRLWARVLYADEPFGGCEGIGIMLPLYFTCFNGLKATAQKLLLSGADVDEEGEIHGPALRAATERGHRDIIQLLLERGANINAEGGFYGSALQVASAGGHKETVQLLLERGVNINTKGGHFGSALQAASAKGYKKTVQLLLERGANINARGGHFGSALQTALRLGRSEIYHLLIGRQWGLCLD
ncbi:hypothetical protein BGZ61DRAFT_485097 [Ilyonectria robusta]|uniref:uncharacterized protein n=1 Tax=Ilyonectria robusta TaxID=1079257 RepID=UPI001E8DF9A6|nr:uncharacterized protein BGZ61DRAFT_485097 [Ilyonectria robusta]KAH8663322.1 hypothetical protein BGZ61DRAFT_485097 [Ilyonectria robusta]